MIFALGFFTGREEAMNPATNWQMFQWWFWNRIRRFTGGRISPIWTGRGNGNCIKVRPRWETGKVKHNSNAEKLGIYPRMDMALLIETLAMKIVRLQEQAHHDFDRNLADRLDSVEQWIAGYVAGGRIEKEEWDKKEHFRLLSRRHWQSLGMNEEELERLFGSTDRIEKEDDENESM